jgi:hypothetical protein
MMRTRTGLCVLICCCAGLAACTAGDPNGPNNIVTTPRVGRPQPPSSAQAALSREAFTPYAALGESNNDGLAPGESQFALASACMTDAGYPNSASSGNLPIEISLGPANLSFAQPWGQWGYLGVTQAEQSGFRLEPGAALSDLGIDVPPPSANQPSIPAAQQTALGKCGTIVQDFTNAAQKGPMAGIYTADQRPVQRCSERRGGEERHAGLVPPAWPRTATASTSRSGCSSRKCRTCTAGSTR